MASISGALRRRVLAPALSDVGFAGRAFPVRPSARTQRLEAIPQAVVTGFEWGLDTDRLTELEQRLALLEPGLRGFGYEGATMAAVVRDALGGFRGDRTLALLRGPARPHVLLAYIGVGFAMARLPRPLWPKVLPDLPDVPHHRALSWLAVDGYAFDRAYFDTRRWVTDRHVPRAHPWQGRPDYFPRAADQGVGRALWFVHGADPGEVAAAVARYPERRRADLWAGVGLAATVAGGADADGLARLRTAAGAHDRELGLGAVFAATARTAAGHVPPHTAVGTAVLAGLGVADAVALGERTAVDDDSAAAPAYERWRAAIRAALPAAAPAALAAARPEGARTC
jgi:enediyne biosynthesis protein E2